MKQLMLLLINMLLLCSCSNGKSAKSNTNQTVAKVEIEEGIEPDSMCNTPQCVIYLQPYADFSTHEVELLLPDLQRQFDGLLYGYWEFKVLPVIPLPEDAYIKNINRYRATVILNHEKKQLKGNEMVIGLTHKDICMDIHGKKNYGIIGCSFKSSRVCVVSNKRLKNKDDYWKPILHEFIHAFYKAGHCPEDNDSCIMQDGKGKGDFTNKNILCSSCKH